MQSVASSKKPAMIGKQKKAGIREKECYNIAVMVLSAKIKVTSAAQPRCRFVVEKFKLDWNRDG